MFDAYLKIDAAPGESQDEGHKDWIQILSFSHSISQPGTNLGGGGNRGSSGNAEHGNFTITKYLDKSTPKLNYFCCHNEDLKKVTIEICRQVNTKICYMKYEFEPCLVSSVAVAGSSNGGDRPIETVCFNYTKINWTYTDVTKDNQKGGDTQAYWDLSVNKGGG